MSSAARISQGKKTIIANLSSAHIPGDIQFSFVSLQEPCGDSHGDLLQPPPPLIANVHFAVLSDCFSHLRSSGSEEAIEMHAKQSYHIHGKETDLEVMTKSPELFVL